MAPKQLLNDDTYRPASSNTEIADTVEAMVKLISKAFLTQVAARVNEKHKYKNVLQITIVLMYKNFSK